MPVLDTSPNPCLDCFRREADELRHQADLELDWLRGGNAPESLALISLDGPAATVIKARLRVDAVAEASGRLPERRVRMTPSPQPTSVFCPASTALAFDKRISPHLPGIHVVAWVIGPPIVAVALGATPRTFVFGVPSVAALRAVGSSIGISHQWGSDRQHIVLLAGRHQRVESQDYSVAMGTAAYMGAALGRQVPMYGRQISAISVEALRDVASEFESYPFHWADLTDTLEDDDA